MRSKHTGRVLASGIIFVGSLVVSANAVDDWGYLKIKNNLSSNSVSVNIVKDDDYISGALDGYDKNDSSAISNPVDYCNIYSNIPNHNLQIDVRPNDSNIPYDIKLSFNGSLTESKSNSLDFSFYINGGTFGSKPILFQSDRLPYGPVVDVKRTIAQNAGRVDLIDVPAGTYDQWTPYNSTDSNGLTIGTRILGDTDDNGIVDINDLSDLTNANWLQEGSGLIGDLSGPNGIPDGKINFIDYSAYAEDYGKDVNSL